MKKLDTILLIDDDQATNFIHKFILEKEQCAKNIICKQSGQDALNYLTSKVDNKYPQHDIIFMDINMHGMNGWEFIEEYKKIDNKQKGEKVVIMLSTSSDPLDKEKAKAITQINRFISKPLTADVVGAIIRENFSVD